MTRIHCEGERVLRRLILIFVVCGLLLLGACSLGSAESSDGEASPPLDAMVVNAVAPYDYESAIDEAIVGHVLRERVEAHLDQCVVDRGGVSTYEPTAAPERESIVAENEIIVDFPNMELLRQRGFTLLVDEPSDPSISRDDYATEEEYIDALEVADARVYAEGELALQGECRGDASFDEVGEPYQLFEDMRSSWIGELREVDTAAAVNDLRDDFRDCVVAGGMSPDPALNEVTFRAQVDGEFLGLADVEQMRAHLRERGQLLAECGQEIYEVKEQLRREAHETFVEEHNDDIARLSNYLYGEGALEPPA
jgi:hypothetical protein